MNAKNVDSQNEMPGWARLLLQLMEDAQEEGTKDLVERGGGRRKTKPPTDAAVVNTEVYNG